MKKLFIILFSLITVISYSQLLPNTDYGFTGAMGNYGFGNVAETGIPFESDLVSNYSTRVGSYIIDCISSDTAKILTRAFINISGTSIYGDKTREQEIYLDTISCTIYIRISQINENGSASLPDIVGSGATSTRKGFAINTFGGTSKPLRFTVSDGEGNYSIKTILDSTNCSTKLKPLDFIDVILVFDYPNRLVTLDLYNPKGSKIINTISVDVTGYAFNNNQSYKYIDFNNPYFAIHNFKKYKSVKTILECINDNDTANLDIWMPSVYDRKDIKSGYTFRGGATSITAVNFAYAVGSDYMLNKGYTRYKTNNVLYPFDIYVANDISGTETAFSLTNYYKIKTTDGNSFHNLVESKIKFNSAFFNRNDTNIWNDISRNSIYYDTTKPYEFHIRELDYGILYTYLKNGYRGKLFPKGISINYLANFKSSVEDNLSISPFSRKYLTNLFLYTSDKKGVEGKEILTYTGDIKNQAVDDSIDLDGYITMGKFKTTKPMLSIRLDDGYYNQSTSWRYLLDSLNVKASLCVITDSIKTTTSTPNSGEFMRWIDVISLYNNGWEIISHGKDGQETRDLSNNDIDIAVLESKQKIESYGIPVYNYVPHLWGQQSLYVRSKAIQNYRTTHAGFTLAVSEEANPQEIVLDNFQALRGDISGNYLLDNSNGITAIKAELDKCLVGNRWVVLYIHGYTAQKAAGLRQVIEYAQSIGVDIVTINEALNNCKYLK